MRRSHLLLVVLTVLAAACGSGAETAPTPEPSRAVAITATESRAATAIPPTDTPESPKATDAPPADTATATHTAVATMDTGLQTVAVLRGGPLTLDGTLDPGEWSTAHTIQLGGGRALLFMHDGDYLYVGIRGRDMGVGSICVDRGEQVAILHASAALGTALYDKGEDGWQRTQDFAWRCRSTSDSPQAQEERHAYLEENGWVASNAFVGTPEEMEFQIAMPEGLLRLVVNYIESPDFDKVFGWPTDVDDDCQMLRLIQGNTYTTLQFSPEGWMTVSAIP